MLDNVVNLFPNIHDWLQNLPWETINFSDWIQIGIALLSLIITVVLTIAIFMIQVRHERETDRIEHNRNQAELENKAVQFLIANDAERDYLPWCVLASNLHRNDKHTRAIYTNFCRCSDDVQNEILRQANFSFCTIPDKSWTNDAFEALKIDIENHQLGRNILYDGEKYFSRGYSTYRSKTWENLDFAEIFNPIAQNLGASSFFTQKKLSLGDYIVEFFHYRYSAFEPAVFNPNPLPPIDYLCNYINFSNADEIVVCAWTIQLVKEISSAIHNLEYTKTKTMAPELEYTDAQVQTFEDAYYAALQELYNTYYHISDERI